MLSNWQKKRNKKEERKKGKKREKQKNRKKKEKVAKEGPRYLWCMPSLETLKAIKGDSSSLTRELDII